MSRDANGNYTLPAGNPVVAGTTIEDTWANPTMSDIAAALTDSLSRTGLGGMLVSFKNADGSIVSPGMSWTNEPTSGWYRKAPGEFWYSVGAVDIFGITSTGIILPPGKTASGLLTPAAANALYLALTGGTLSGTLNVNGRLIVDVSATNAIALSATNTGSNGASLYLLGNGAVTPSKSLAAQDGNLYFRSHAGTIICTLTDVGQLNLTGTITVTKSDDNQAAIFTNNGLNGAFITLRGNGATTINKYLQSKDGAFNILSNGFVAILTLSDAGVLDVGPSAGGGQLRINRLDNSSAGARMYLCRAVDNVAAWALDVSGADASAAFRIYCPDTALVPVLIEKTGIANMPQGVRVSKRALVTPINDNDGNFDLSAGTDFICSNAGPIVLGFTNPALGQRGMIKIYNPSGWAITKGVVGGGGVIVSPATLFADISALGAFRLVAYWCDDGTNIILSCSDNMG